MKTIAKFAVAATIAIGATSAVQAQTVPNPANPNPAFPIATDGSVLPQAYVPASANRGPGLYTGRSVAVDAVGAPVGFAADTAGAAVGAAGNVVGGVLSPLGF